MNVLLYVDGTTGGMVLQVLLSGFVGGFVVLKLFWGNLVNAVLRRKDPAPADAADQAEQAPS